MNDFNNTYIYFNYPKDKYLYKFQKFVYNTLFTYYKDYIYKAQLEYYSDKEIPTFASATLDDEDYDPLQLKILPALFKKNGW